MSRASRFHREVSCAGLFGSLVLRFLFAGATFVVAVLMGDAAVWAAGSPVKQIPISDANLCLSPYVWKCSGEGVAARAEATMPGAYLRAVVQNTATIGVVIDATSNVGCPPPSMPVVEYSVDDGPFVVTPLTKTGEVYTLRLAQGLDPANPHRVEFYFRAADLGQKRWMSSLDHLRIVGLAVDENGTAIPCPQRSKRAIGFGDSITEGVGADGLFKSWQSLEVNNARGSWFPIVCAALDCEYGQLGSGGQGILNTKMEVPPLPKTWDHYDATASRLTDGRLLPEPDYVFLAMGTNDFGEVFGQSQLFTETYGQLLASFRAACPHSQIFCVTSPIASHTEDIKAAVASRKQAGDARVHVIDTARLNNGFSAQCKPSRMAHDGVHPSAYGNAMISALVAAEVEKALGKE